MTHSCPYQSALERLTRRLEGLTAVPCPQAWQSEVRLLLGETEDYLHTVPLSPDAYVVCARIYAQLLAAERQGWRPPYPLMPWIDA